MKMNLRTLVSAGAVALSIAAFPLTLSAASHAESDGDDMAMDSDMSMDGDMMAPEMVAENIAVVTHGDIKLHTFYGISNSHIIETANELRLVDAQFTKDEATALKAYIDGLGKPLAQVILSHNHPDHWFGAQFFEDTAPIATSTGVQEHLAEGSQRYIDNLSKVPFMAGSVPEAVIVPSETIATGAQTWDGLDVIVEEVEDQEAHASVMIKIPAAKTIIGQDLFYNNNFLVASERSRNRNWANVLAGIIAEDADEYYHFFVGHGKNGGVEILGQNIVYLNTLEAVLEEGLSKEETKAKMLAAFPDMEGKGLLDISLRNLFAGH